MKIAIVFSGQGRWAEYAYSSIKEKILDKYDVDVYCQMWWDDEIKENGYVGSRRTYDVPNDLPKIVERLYNPKQFLINKSSDLSEYPYGHLPFVSQFVGIQRACNLFDWSQYDFIVKMRYDLEVYNFPDLHLLDKTKFYTGCDDGSFYYDDLDFFSDLSYILPNDMKQFTQVIDNVITNRLQIISPEQVLFTTLKLLNFRDRMIRLSWQQYGCDIKS